MRVFSFGGGVQSVAVMVLSAQRILPYTHFVFANVGNDSENPGTMEYIENIAKPFALRHGLDFVEVQWKRKPTSAQTLYEALVEDRNDIAIPVHLKGGGPSWRNCTSKWKVKVIDRWMRDNAGATKQNRQPIGVGISTDEIHRMRTDDPERDVYAYKEYPLVDLRLNRIACQQIIVGAGLPPAPKSSCWFCPYKADKDWLELRKLYPHLFERVIELEDTINQKRKKYGDKDNVYLWGKQRPMRDFQFVETVDMFDEGMACESGHCMT
jgi:hypothetical protein